MYKKLRMTIIFAVALSMLLVGCSSKKANQERLHEISEKIDVLFNEKKDDFIKDMTKENLDEINQSLATEGAENLHEENKQLYTNIQEDLQLLSNMFDYDQSIQAFVEKDEQITEEKLSSFKEKLEQFKDKESFFDRQNETIKQLEIQFEEIKKTNDVEKALEDLFEDDKVKDTVTEKQYEKIKELIKQMDNEETKASFTKKLEKIEVKLKEIEEQKLKEQKLAEEEKLKEQKEAEEKKEQQLAEEQRKKEEQKADESKKQTQEKAKQEKNQDENHAQKPEVKPEQKQEDKKPEPAVEATYVDGVIIASKKYPLPANHAPGESAKARAAFNEMAKAAKKDGFNLIAFSTYRSYEYQVDLYNRYVERDGQAAADRYSARPGYSEHQTGLAFDIGDANMSDLYFEVSPVSEWLAAEAYKYGFILRYPNGKEGVTGYMYEPWHYRYVGVDLAKKIFEQKTTLEEYLGI